MGMDCRNWDEDAYRESVLGERETLTRTIFRVTFAPNANPNPNSDHFASASSSGSIASCSIDSCLEHGCGTARGENSVLTVYRIHKPWFFQSSVFCLILIPWGGALSPILENNAMTVDCQGIHLCGCW
ncbi:THO complex subunit 6-like isoform X2 [Primulina tabacum]|uniref:THO complex subunit 6-like isoform X2 n=1 Tax=Primulina tabacum TaxID=48773 RepID=UPI003F592C72